MSARKYYSNTLEFLAVSLGHLSVRMYVNYFVGLVPEQTSQVAQDGEDVGQVEHHG